MVLFWFLPQVSTCGYSHCAPPGRTTGGRAGRIVRSVNAPFLVSTCGYSPYAPPGRTAGDHTRTIVRPEAGTSPGVDFEELLVALLYVGTGRNRPVRLPSPKGIDMSSPG